MRELTVTTTDIDEARAAMAEVKLIRAQTFFGSLTAEEVAVLKRDPQIANHMRMLARELETLADAVEPETVSLEEAEERVA